MFNALFTTRNYSDTVNLTTQIIVIQHFKQSRLHTTASKTISISYHSWYPISSTYKHIALMFDLELNISISISSSSNKMAWHHSNSKPTKTTTTHDNLWLMLTTSKIHSAFTVAYSHALDEHNGASNQQFNSITICIEIQRLVFKSIYYSTLKQTAVKCICNFVIWAARLIILLFGRITCTHTLAHRRKYVVDRMATATSSLLQF